VIDVILQVVDDCADLDTENKKIGFAASELTQAVAQLATSSGKIAKACAPPPAPPCDPVAAPCDPVVVPAPVSDPCAVQRRLGVPCSVPQRRLGNMPINTAMCVVDVKGIMKHLVKAIQSLNVIKKKCKHGDEKCAHNILKVVIAFGGLGEYISGAIGSCSQADFGGKFGSDGNKDGLQKLDLAVTPQCASGISGLVKALAKVSKAAVDLSIESHKAESKHHHHDSRRRRRRRRKGSGGAGAGAVSNATIMVPVEVQVAPVPVVPGAARLYAAEGKDEDATTSSTNFVLGALLPVTALVSFVGGRFYAKRGRGMAPSHQVVSLEEQFE